LAGGYWIVSEVPLPLLGRKFGDPHSWMLTDALENAEIPGLSSHGNGPERALRMIGIDRHIRVCEEHFQAQSAFARISQYLSKRSIRR
jgi:hypothetical protein